nr:MAG TPA: major outer membrane lipoprotein [Caudoviricetes sp.]
MNKEKTFLTSSTIELSEDEENSQFLTLVNRICYYDEPNLNSVLLPSDTAEECAQSLIDMPVYAKCRTNADGEPTFGSHEVALDADGELFFDTTPIGVHTAVEIKDDTVDVNGKLETLPCLFATQKIWKRNKNAVAAIKRLFAEGKLHNSWEIASYEYSFADGVKTITGYEFEGNTFLGYEFADPAYGKDAKVVSLSQTDELMVAEALSRDLIDQKSSKEDETLKKNKTSAQVEPQVDPQVDPQATEPAVDPAQAAPVEPAVEPAQAEPQNIEPAQAEPAEPQPEEPQGEPVVASLTDWDIQRKIDKGARGLIDGWYWVAYLFPEDHKALLRVEGGDELSYVQVSYVVNDDDTVTVSDPVDVKLSVSVSEINSKVAELTDTIASLNQKVNDLTAEVETLTPYREAAQKAEHDAAEAKLRAYAENSKQFTEEELQSEEMTKIFSELDESALKMMIADRVVSAQAQQIQATVSAPQVQLSNTSNLTVNEPSADGVSLMRAFLRH